MPELPEVQTVVTELNKRLKNRRVKTVIVTRPKIISIGPGTVSNIRDGSIAKVTQFIKLITGQRIVSVKRRAKLLIFNLSGPLTMLAHLKMTGQFIFEDKKQQKRTSGKYRILNKTSAPLVQLPSNHTHAIFKFTDGSVLYFNDIRQFGYLKLVKDSDISKIKELNELGPEPLAKKFTFEKFRAILASHPKGKIKQVIMDPRVVVGIGNIYSDEILSHAKVHPSRIISTLNLTELKSIYKYIGTVLRQAIKYKGSSVGDFIRPDGSWGSMSKHHLVYGKYKKPCTKCGTIIERLKIGGRTASFCPKCQI